MNRKIKDALTLGIAAAFVLMFALWSKIGRASCRERV